MKVWKIVSGILSIAIGAFAAVQSFFAGVYNTLAGNGQSSGTAGLIVAVVLLTGGIVSLATHRGSRGGDIAMALLYCTGGIVGFVMAGSFLDLRLWSLWAVLCGVVAAVDAGLPDRTEETRPAPPRTAPPDVQRGPATFQEVILEPDPARRDAAIDALPEWHAKSYLKQAMNVLVPLQMRGGDEDGGLVKALVALLAVLGIFIITVIGAGVFVSSSGGRQTAASPPPAASRPVGESAPPQQTPEQSPPVRADGRFSVGESAVKDGLTVTLLSVTQSQGTELLAPGEGKTFVLCEFEIENNSGADVAISSALSFSAYVDKYSTNLSLSAISSSGKQQLNGTVAAGRRMRGVIGYEVDADWSEIELRFADNIWSGEETIFAYSNAI